MKALVYTGIETLEMRDVADPNPGSSECVVRVESVGICGKVYVRLYTVPTLL